MFSKLLKTDLRKNMRWLWILFGVTILVAGLSRGCKELGTSITFFKIFGIIFDTISYSLIANCLIQPFLRNFMNFKNSLYGDESYLTHTLPVTKNQIINSKFLTAIIELLLGFATVIVSVLIMFASPEMFTMLNLLLSTLILGKISTILAITLLILLVIVEFLMFISIIFFAIVIGFKSNEKKVKKAFLYTGLMALLSMIVLGIVMVVVLLINGVNLSNSTLVLSSSIFIGIMLAGIVVYSLATLLYYFLTKKEFNKGVNVD